MKGLPFGRALAQLVVIVVGVLVALLAESAWNDYQGKVRGLAYLARLADEVEANLELLGQDKAWARQSCSSADLALAQLREADGASDPSALLRFAVVASLYQNPRYQRVTYDDLVATGALSLIDDAPLREKIVATYTDFFGALESWRPPKDSPLRTVVLRAVPGAFINKVSKECLLDSETGSWVTALQCSSTPDSGRAEDMISKLKEAPDLEGYLLERAWQTCEFDEDMSAASASFLDLLNVLGVASQSKSMF